MKDMSVVGARKPRPHRQSHGRVVAAKCGNVVGNEFERQLLVHQADIVRVGSVARHVGKSPQARTVLGHHHDHARLIGKVGAIKHAGSRAGREAATVKEDVDGHRVALRINVGRHVNGHGTAC